MPPKKFTFSTFDMTQLKSLTLLKQGAEAKLYTGLVVENNQEAIVKERFKKTYRHSDLDRSLTAKRIKNEVKLLQKADTLSVSVPKVFKADLDNGVIVMEFVKDSITCREFILNLVKETLTYHDTLAELAHRIGKVIGTLHLHEVIHGDLTTSNILVVKREEELKLVFIDFGLSFVSRQLEDKAVDLYVLERALLSTHSQQAEHIFEHILKGYREGHAKNVDKVIERFEAVRLRGRKRTMIG